ESPREREAYEVIESAAGEVCVDERSVNLARMFHRLRHGLLGDGVEHHAFDGLILERLLLLERLQHMPGDCLTLAVGVGGKDQFVSTLERSRDVIYALIGFGVDFPDHTEVCLGIDRAALGRQVANMPKGGAYLIPWAEVFTDRLHFGGCLDYDDIHENPISYPPVPLNHGGIGRIVGPEHGEGGPCCQIGPLRGRVRPTKWGT